MNSAVLCTTLIKCSQYQSEQETTLINFIDTLIRNIHELQQICVHLELNVKLIILKLYYVVHWVCEANEKVERASDNTGILIIIF